MVSLDGESQGKTLHWMLWHPCRTTLRGYSTMVSLDGESQGGALFTRS